MRGTRLASTLAVAALTVAVVAIGAGGAAGSATKTPPKITVGFLQILGASPSAQRNQNQFMRAAKVLGWKVNVVDAQGDPAKMASGIQSFVTQKVDAIVTIAVAPAAAQQALTAAKKDGIPAITIAGPNPDPNHLYAAQIAPNDSALGALSAQHLCDTLGKGAKIVAQVLPAARRARPARHGRPGSLRALRRQGRRDAPGRLRERGRRRDQVDARHAPREPVGDRRLGRPGLRIRPGCERRQPARPAEEGEGVRLPRRRRDARRAPQGRPGGEPRRCLLQQLRVDRRRPAAAVLRREEADRSERAVQRRPDPGHADHCRERPEDRGRVPVSGPGAGTSCRAGRRSGTASGRPAPSRGPAPAGPRADRRWRRPRANRR